MAPRTEVSALIRKLPARGPRRGEDAVGPLGVIAPPPISIECPHFSGSLGMLFACVKERKVDLAQVPLLPICEAYFLYLAEASLGDLDEAAAALVALAYLLERKAWGLLPTAEKEPEAEAPLELIAPTSHEYETAIRTLALWQEERDRLYFRPPDCGPEPYEIPFDLTEVTIADLARAFERLFSKAAPANVAPLSKPRRSIAEQMKVVIKALAKEFKPLGDLLVPPFTREDAVYWFLALLELIRLGQAKVKLAKHDIAVALAA